VLVLAVRTIGRQWTSVRASAATLQPDWLLVLGSALPVLLAYAILVQTWRAMLRSWTTDLSFLEAARITFVSNLGKYLPGKVWQIAAMAVMAKQRGVSPIAATGSSLLVNAVNVFTAFAVVLLSGVRVLDVSGSNGRGAAIALVVGAALALFSLPFVVPRLARFAARLTGRAFAAPEVPPRALVVATIGTALAWILYGTAFQLFARALFGTVSGGMTAWIAVYTASYIIGYLAVFAPGGIGVREVMLVASLASLKLMTQPQALVLAVVSRLWLTVLEVLPGALFIGRDAFYRRAQVPE
jgi:hypothetical protein